MIYYCKVLHSGAKLHFSKYKLVEITLNVCSCKSVPYLLKYFTNVKVLMLNFKRLLFFR